MRCVPAVHNNNPRRTSKCGSTRDSRQFRSRRRLVAKRYAPTNAQHDDPVGLRISPRSSDNRRSSDQLIEDDDVSVRHSE